MLGRGVLSRLHCLTQLESPTLTVYLDIDQNTMSNRNGGYIVQAEALMKDLKTRYGAYEGLEEAIGDLRRPSAEQSVDAETGVGE